MHQLYVIKLSWIIHDSIILPFINTQLRLNICTSNALLVDLGAARTDQIRRQQQQQQQQQQQLRQDV